MVGDGVSALSVPWATVRLLRANLRLRGLERRAQRLQRTRVADRYAHVPHIDSNGNQVTL